jgi:hypothetical protein
MVNNVFGGEFQNKNIYFVLVDVFQDFVLVSEQTVDGIITSLLEAVREVDKSKTCNGYICRHCGGKSF